MQRVNFGRIEGLVIREGEPVLNNPVPRIILEVKFAGENGPRAEASLEDFALKSQVVDLLSYFERLQNVTIDVLTIKHGLPFSMQVEQMV
jgi:hypothetical protein